MRASIPCVLDIRTPGGGVTTRKPGRPGRKVNDPDLALRIEHNRQRIVNGEQALKERRA